MSVLRGGKRYHLGHTILISCKTAPVASIFYIFLSIINALFLSIKIWATTLFIDTALSIFQGLARESAILFPLFAILGTVIYENLREKCTDLLRKRIELKLREELRVQMIEKCASLKFQNIEDPNICDLISRVLKEPEIRFSNAFSQLLGAAVLCINVISVFIILLHHAWWVALILLVLFVPVFWFSLQGGKKQYEAEQAISKEQRRYEYLFRLLTARENVDERTLFQYSDRITDPFLQAWNKTQQLKFRVKVKWFLRSKGSSVLVSLVITLLALVLLGSLSTGKMSAGIFIALMQAIVEVTNMLSWQLSGYVDHLAQDVGYLKDVTRFMELEEVEGALLPPKPWKNGFQQLEFRNVSFRYPNTERYILNGINLVLKSDKHYSIVGANGAGKTTIVKLLTGMYSDYEGEILIDGRELRTLSSDELKGFVSCVFQDFARYDLCLHDNITVGCIGVYNPDERVQLALNYIPLSDVIQKLPQGMEQMLGKSIEGGIDLSGGEWQRIALARGAASTAPLRILDEPTAAIDPISEGNLFFQFHQMCQESCAIYITHRLGPSKLSDEIIVIDEGKITESGTFEALMARNGLYKQMYEEQRSWYQ